MQNEILESTISLVKECGERLRTQHFQAIREKEGCFDLVSDLDEKIEELIIQRLSSQFPDHQFLGEERHREMGKDVWIIDPIDGTTNFITAHLDFAISIAYYHDFQPVFGIVYDVMKEELFVGIHQEGAYLNNKQLPMLQEKALSDCVVDISLHSMSTIDKKFGKSFLPLQGNIRGHRSLGCASLCICHIANQTLDAYISMHVKCWDYAAARIILEEVGGHYQIMRDFFTTDATGAVFANNKNVCDYFVDYVS